MPPTRTPALALLRALALLLPTLALPALALLPTLALLPAPVASLQDSLLPPPHERLLELLGDRGAAPW